MRKIKFVELPDPVAGVRVIEVREVTLREAINVKDQFGAATDVPGLLADAVERWTDVKFEDLLDLAPSELKALWLAFREVNGDFFAAAQFLGLDAVVAGVVKAMRTELLNSMRGSSATGTGPRPSTTD